MKNTSVFATEEQIERCKAALKAPVMFLSGGTPMHESPQQAAHACALQQGLPEIPGYYGLNLETGEFVQVD